MSQIIAIGFESLDPLQTRQLKTDTVTFQLSFNQLRSFRPARMSSVQTICLNTVFDPDGFHFDKAYLKKEIFAEGDIKVGNYHSYIINSRLLSITPCW